MRTSLTDTYLEPIDYAQQDPAPYVLMVATTIGDNYYAVDRWRYLGERIVEFLQGSEVVIAFPVMTKWVLVRADRLARTTVGQKADQVQRDVEQLVGGIGEAVTMAKPIQKKARVN